MLAADTHGAGPRLVMVHGFGQTRDCWGPLPADLARDHEVTRVDAPGHGEAHSTAADLAFTAKLLGPFGPATFLGYSMGGRMCLEVALRHPGQARGLVLVSATAGIEPGADRARRRADDDTLATSIEQDGVAVFVERWLSQPLFAGLPDNGRFEAERRTNTPAGLASSLRLAGTGTQMPSWDRLESLAMPVLVVAGARDAKFSALGGRMAEAIGPNATLAVIAGAGHSTHLEAPEAFRTTLRSWLDHHGL